MRRKNMNRKDMITIAFSIARVYQRSHRKRLVNSLLLLLIPPSPFSSSLSSSLSSLSYCFVCFVWFLFRKRHESALICLEFRRFRSCAFQSNGAMCVCVWGRGETSQKFTSDNRCSRRLIRPLRMNRRSDLLSAAARNESARYLAVRSRLVSVWVSTILGRVISTLWLFSLSLSLSLLLLPPPPPSSFHLCLYFLVFFLVAGKFFLLAFCWMIFTAPVFPRPACPPLVIISVSCFFFAPLAILHIIKKRRKKKKDEIKIFFLSFFFRGQGRWRQSSIFLIEYVEDLLGLPVGDVIAMGGICGRWWLTMIILIDIYIYLYLYIFFPPIFVWMCALCGLSYVFLFLLSPLLSFFFSLFLPFVYFSLSLSLSLSHSIYLFLPLYGHAASSNRLLERIFDPRNRPCKNHLKWFYYTYHFYFCRRKRRSRRSRSRRGKKKESWKKRERNRDRNRETGRNDGFDSLELSPMSSLFHESSTWAPIASTPEFLRSDSIRPDNSRPESTVD